MCLYRYDVDMNLNSAFSCRSLPLGQAVRRPYLYPHTFTSRLARRLSHFADTHSACLITYLFHPLSTVAVHCPVVRLCLHHRGATGCHKCSHRPLPSMMADICRDWLTDQTTDCCFVVIGSPSHPTVLCSAAKIDPGVSIWSAIFVGS